MAQWMQYYRDPPTNRQTYPRYSTALFLSLLQVLQQSVDKQMNDTPHLCAICDCDHDAEHSWFSSAGAGPFCSECWQSLTDADEALLLDKRLAAAEQKIHELEREIARLEKGFTE
jgi:hypothetical protein